MNKITSLEKDVLISILSSVLAKRDNMYSIVDTLTVKERKFSSFAEGQCSGFYTTFNDNAALVSVENIPTEFSVQARNAKLSFGEMGFYVFCNASAKSFVVMEGFFYGDERLSVEELMDDNHSFVVYTIPGL